MNGDPVFFGKVSSGQGNWHPVTGPDDPRFYGGAEFGSAPIDFDISILTDLRNEAVFNGDNYTGFEIWILFTGSTYTVYSDPYITPLGFIHNLTDFNGLIYSDMTIHVKGVVDGRITVFSDNRIWIEDNIVCANNPSSDPTSDDFIGLVAEHQIILVDNLDNRNDLFIHAALMSRHDEILVQNAGTGSRGSLTIIGSIAQQDYHSSIATDYTFNHIYDPRLKDKTPPYFPRTTMVELTYRSN
jgi:hypothetical protein